MGTFTVLLQVAGPDRQRFTEVEALVDTGATHTLLPGDLLRRLGIETVDRVSFQLADERVVEYEVGEARLRLDGRERTALVVFGPEGATPLLGATTLELFNMAVDPVRRRLVPVPGLLK
ncbi:MAG: clan AA aspartic protease [Chloroflexota bacterium]|nr:clan AA aspartic protease [Chloroflexota bacterium]